MRNPKDQLVSWYKFRLMQPYYKKGKLKELHPEDWNEFFEKYITGIKAIAYLTKLRSWVITDFWLSWKMYLYRK